MDNNSILISRSKGYIKFNGLRRELIKDNKIIEREFLKFREQYNKGLRNDYVDKIKIKLNFKNNKTSEFFLEMDLFMEHILEDIAYPYTALVREIHSKCLSRFDVNYIRKRSLLTVDIEFLMNTIDYDY